jgi:serine palmitoyltransferase
VGSKEVVDHQRLASQAYVFSASLPPYSATAALTALQLLEQDEGARVRQLASRSRALRQELGGIPGALVRPGLVGAGHQ